jgi:hypothetical protein
MEQMLGSLNEGDSEAMSCSFPVTYAVVITDNTVDYIVNLSPPARTKSWEERIANL